RDRDRVAVGILAGSQLRDEDRLRLPPCTSSRVAPRVPAAPRRGMNGRCARAPAAPPPPAAPAPPPRAAVSPSRPHVPDVRPERLTVARDGCGGDPVLPALHLVAVLARRGRDDVEEIEGLGEEGLADERSRREALALGPRQEPLLREQDLA